MQSARSMQHNTFTSSVIPCTVQKSSYYRGWRRPCLCEQAAGIVASPGKMEGPQATTEPALPAAVSDTANDLSYLQHDAQNTNIDADFILTNQQYALYDPA